ncbi:hypothetical protein D3C81_1004290 [compost metagenome]
MVRRIDHQLTQVVAVVRLAVLSNHLFHQLHGANGFVLRGIHHRHRGIDGIAHVETMTGIVEHYAECLALQRNARLHGQRFRIQAQYLRGARVITKPAGGGHEQSILRGAVRQFVKALGHGLALHTRSSGGVGGGWRGGEGARCNQRKRHRQRKRDGTGQERWRHCELP